MSKFMNFLDNIDNDIINETYVDDVIVEEVETKPTPKKRVVGKKPKATKKDSSVKLIEARIRTKLDDIGLNESAISEVVLFVLNDIQKVNDVVSSTKTQQPKQTQVQENNVPTSVMGRAESLLAGLPETATIGSLPIQGGDEVVAESDLSGVASHASSLL